MYGSGSSHRLAALAAALVLASSTAALASADEHNHEHGKIGTKLVLDQGRKWQTDAVARSGMAAIRSVLAADLKAIHDGKQTDAQYQTLAANVNGEVANMVKNCRLDPKADAQFHVVIAEIMAAAEIMEGKQAGAPRRRGAEQVARALNAYGRHFAHPGWKRI